MAAHKQLALLLTKAGRRHIKSCDQLCSPNDGAGEQNIDERLTLDLLSVASFTWSTDQVRAQHK
jgi:hypothetical protein